MADFKKISDAHAMFAENNWTGGADNCIFVGAKDVNAQGLQGGLRGSMGLVGGAIASKIASKDALENLLYDGLLINQTEKGLGFIPLWNVGMNLNGDIAKMEAKPDNFFSVSNDAIESVTVKDLSFLNRKVKTVRITLKHGQKIQFVAKIAEKQVPYQETNFGKFMAKYL